MASDLSPVFDAAGQAFDVDPGLLRAIQQTESGGNPQAVSPAGAIGNMQFMPATARAVGIDPTDPVQSIWGAANLMAQNLKATRGDVPAALRMYNAGPDTSRWNNPQTQAYPEKVAQNYVFAQPTATDAMSGTAPQPASAYGQLFGSTDPGQSQPQTQKGGSAYSTLFGQTDPGQEKPPPQQGVLSDVNDAVNAAGERLDQGALWALKQIPGVSGVLQGSALDLDKLSAADKASVANIINTPAGQLGSEAGRLLGYGALAETGAGALGGALGAGGELVGGLGGRVLQAGRNMLTGSGATGVVGNALTGATSGAAKAAIAGTAAGSDDVSDNALLGAPLGLVGAGVGAVARPLLSYAGRGLASSGTGLLNRLAPASEDIPLTATVTPAGATSTAEAGAEAEPQASAGWAPQPDRPVPPVNLGTVPNPANGQSLADQVIAAHAAGAPMAAVQSQIPGVNLTLAEATQNPGVARIEKLMRQQNPNAFQSFDQANQAARNSFVQQVTGSPTDISNMEAARAAAEAQGREQAFANSQPVDAMPSLNQIDTAIDGNRGNSAVVASLNKARSSLISALDDVQKDGYGNIVRATASPENLWNVRKNIGYGLSSASGDADQLRAATAQLTPVMGTLSDTIEQGAPGFKDYAADYAARSQAIDAARYLQTANLTDAAGNVQPGRLNSVVNAIQKARLTNSSSDASAVSDQQLAQLQALRNDLNLKAGAQALAAARGSDTAQNLFTQSKVASMIGGKAGAIADVLASMGGMEASGSPVGALAGAATRGAQMLYQNRLAATHAAATQGILNRLMISGE